MRLRPNRESQPIRWHLLLLVPVLLLVLCTLAGFIWWQYYKTTPSYSLAVLVEASERNDTAAFDALFVMDRVVETFASEMAQNRGVNLPDSLRVRLQSIAPTVTATIKPIVREAIRRRIRELAQQSENKPFLLKVFGVLLKANVVQRGNQATATISQDDQSLELELEQRDRKWKVVSVRDDELTSRIVDDVTKELPAKISPDGLRNPLNDILPKTIP